MLVEGSLKCEQWIQKDDNEKESPLWLDRVIEKSELSWKYPFSQNHSFILTVRAGLEGYHMSVDGKHVASFPYTTVSCYGLPKQICFLCSISYKCVCTISSICIYAYYLYIHVCVEAFMYACVYQHMLYTMIHCRKQFPIYILEGINTWNI